MPLRPALPASGSRGSYRVTRSVKIRKNGGFEKHRMLSSRKIHQPLTSIRTAHTFHSSPSSVTIPKAHLLQDFRSSLNTSVLIPCVSIHDTLRAHHPDSYIVCVPAHIGLLPYAEAGLAQCQLDSQFPNYYTLLLSNENISHKKDDGMAKKLDRRDHLVVYDYSWREISFKIYAFRYYVARAYTGTKDEHYIVAEPSAKGAIVDLIRAADEYENKAADEEIWVYEDGDWEKSESLWHSVRNSSWDDVILDEGMKSRMREDIEGFFGRREQYKRLAVPWKRGVIFHGLPGNGKTASIKAAIRAISLRPTPISSLYVKSLPSTDGDDISSIFSKARSCSPCLLIFEDLDSLVHDKIRSFFLNEVDGLEGNDGIMMVGSTNYLDRLDPGISKRPSRFDRKYHFRLPREEERKRYCQSWRRRLEKTASKLNIPENTEDKIAALTEGFSFAYLQELWISTLMATARTAEAENGEGDGDAKANTGAEATDQSLWEALQRQVKILRNEMSDSKKSVEDAERNSALSDAKSEDHKTTGFGLSR